MPRKLSYIGPFFSLYQEVLPDLPYLSWTEDVLCSVLVQEHRVTHKMDHREVKDSTTRIWWFVLGLVSALTPWWKSKEGCWSDVIGYQKVDLTEDLLFSLIENGINVAGVHINFAYH